MTRLTGDIRQIGVVVRDIDAAVQQWSGTIGIGPFCIVREMTFDDYRYRGVAAESPVVTLAIAQSGPLQIELITQLNDAPSAYRDFLAAGEEGMQHLACWCASKDAFDEKYRRLLEEGLEVVHEGRLGEIDIRFAYFSQPGGSWPQLELCEGLMPGALQFFNMLDKLSKNWDGRQVMVDLMAAEDNE
jgi:catechol 2,3-dioxygenase-like lactoylglutathione lyase family enzyme